MALAQLDLWAKIVRAQESIENLDAEIAQYLESDPKPYRIVGELHNDNREFGFTAYSDPVPLRFSILAGEIVHHLRSALDHVVWAMATKNSQNPSNRIQFPICATRRKFEKALKNGIVRGVGEAAVKIIEGVQPFNSKDPRDAILHVLHDFDITDKHKILRVVTTAAQIGKAITIGDSRGPNPPPDELINIVRLSAPGPVAVHEQGARVFTVYFGEPSPTARMRANLDVTIAFECLGKAENFPVIRGLTAFHQGVVHTLKEFDPLLN